MISRSCTIIYPCHLRVQSLGTPSQWVILRIWVWIDPRPTIKGHLLCGRLRCLLQRLVYIDSYPMPMHILILQPSLTAHSFVREVSLVKCGFTSSNWWSCLNLLQLEKRGPAMLLEKKRKTIETYRIYQKDSVLGSSNWGQRQPSQSPPHHLLHVHLAVKVIRIK